MPSRPVRLILALEPGVDAEQVQDSLPSNDDDFTTVAGLVILEKGTVPNAGERLDIRGLEVEVVEADERRISRLRVRAKQEEATDETDETQKQIPAGKKN